MHQFNKFTYILATFLLTTWAIIGYQYLKPTPQTGAPPSDVTESEIPDHPYAWLVNWKRPEGPPRVGLQVGHLDNHLLPEELEHLIGNTGAQGGGKTEWEVNMDIAQKTKTILESQGIIVDILPSTIPPSYWADAFIAIHADGSEDTTISGFKISPPYRDFTGSARQLSDLIQASYLQSTALPIDPNITRNMRGYYAFSWWRNQHAIHPMTTAVILETGFLTSPADRRIIVDDSDRSAQGLADGVVLYLQSQDLL